MAPDERREQLLDAALGVILEQGYSGVSVESVARAAGVTRPVIYDHFLNLAGLLQVLIRREETYAAEQLERVVPEDPTGDPIEILASGVGRFLDAVTSRPATWRIILLPPDGTPAVVRQQIDRYRAQTLDRIERLVRWAMTQPGLPDDLDAELAARAIRDLGEEAGRMVLTEPEHYPASRYERFVQSVMGLLSARTD